MIRLPNELYRFDETVLTDFVTIMRCLGDEPASVHDLHHRLSNTMAPEDLVEALCLLLALNRIQLDTTTGVIARAH